MKFLKKKKKMKDTLRQFSGLEQTCAPQTPNKPKEKEKKKKKLKKKLPQVEQKIGKK